MRGSGPAGWLRHGDRREPPREFPRFISGCGRERRQEASARQDTTLPEVGALVSFEPMPLVIGGASASEEGGPCLGKVIPAAVLGIELLASGDVRRSGGRKPCVALVSARGVHVSDGGQHGCSFGWFYQG